MGPGAKAEAAAAMASTIDARSIAMFGMSGCFSYGFSFFFYLKMVYIYCGPVSRICDNFVCSNKNAH